MCIVYKKKKLISILIYLKVLRLQQRMNPITSKRLQLNNNIQMKKMIRKKKNY